MFRNYLLTAYKVFMRRKLFTAINLACIVLTLVVLMVITALLENAFYPTGVEGKSERMLQVMTMETHAKDDAQIRSSPIGYKVIDKYLRPLKSVELVSALTMAQTVSAYQGERVSELMMRRTDANYWKILDFKLLAGRLPTADDDAQGRFVAVINAATARKLFGDAPAVGNKIDVGSQHFEVIGVVGDEFHLNAYADIWVPITTFPNSQYKSQMWGEFSALLLAKNKADLPQIRAEVQAIAKTVEIEGPDMWEKAYFWADSKLDLFARQLLSHNTQPDSGATQFVASIVVMMLLFMMMPALNLVNLNMGRIMERSSEIGVRKAFGATSAQLVGQLVMENILLCMVGGVIGLLCAEGVLLWLEGSGLIPYLNVSLNLAVFGYGLLITVVFGLLSGVIPAWKMSRLDPVHALKGVA